MKSAIIVEVPPHDLATAYVYNMFVYVFNMYVYVCVYYTSLLYTTIILSAYTFSIFIS